MRHARLLAACAALVLTVTLLSVSLPAAGPGPGTAVAAADPVVFGRTIWSAVPSGTWRTGGFAVEWSNPWFGGPCLRAYHVSDPGRDLWRSVPGRAFVSAGAGDATVHESRGMFKVADSITAYYGHQGVDRIREKNGAVIINGRFPEASGALSYVVTLRARNENRLDFDVRLREKDAGQSFNRVWLEYESTPDERFFGFGEQFTHVDMKGRELPILSQEQGIGRGLQPVTLLMDLAAGSGGDWHTTYASVPQYITSRCRSLFLKNSEYCVFDMRSPDAVRIKLHAARMRGAVLSGSTPLDLVEEYTRYSGRMRPLPAWVDGGAIVGMQGGTARVRDVLEDLLSHEVPVAAFWLQDWEGKRQTIAGSQLWWNWEVDDGAYPGWDDLVSDLRGLGIRVMAYVNPFLVDASEKPGHRRNLYREADEAGYLVKDRSGGNYMIMNTSFSAAMVDLTNPAAREWLKAVIRDEMLDRGISGWMADYGEALPFDCALADGSDPASYHNLYSVEWAELNREVVREEGLEDEVLFMSRSGHARSPGVASSFWLGDQLVTWDEFDGIKTAVCGLLSGGISGYSINHSDIGGYTTIGVSWLQGFGWFRSKELLMRWMEMNAFTAIFRTHEGNVPEINAQFYSDEETFGHFTRFAKVYAALAPYRRGLEEEAAARGYPVVRHPLLHYPGDPQAWGLTRQFMLGSEFMVAPVLDPGAETVSLYLPAGRWVHLWTGDVYGGQAAGAWVTVDSPLGQPPVFYRYGSQAGGQLEEALGQQGLLER